MFNIEFLLCLQMQLLAGAATRLWMVCILPFTLHFLPQGEAASSHMAALSLLPNSSEPSLPFHWSHDNSLEAETWYSSHCVFMDRGAACRP